MRWHSLPCVLMLAANLLAQEKRKAEPLIGTWVNSGYEYSVGKMRGRVLVIHFISTTSEESVQQVAKLTTLLDKYYSRGLSVLGMAFEDVQLVKTFCQDNNVKYPVGSDQFGSTRRWWFRDRKVSLPQVYLVGTDGTIVGRGIPTDPQLQEQLVNVVLPTLDRPLHGALAEVEAHYKWGAYGIAYKQAGQLLKSRDEAVAKDALYIRNKIERYEAVQRMYAKEGLSAALTDKYAELLVLKHQYNGLPLAEWAEEHLAKVRKNADKLDARLLTRHKAAWQKFELALRREMSMGTSEKEKKRLIVIYQQLAKDQTLVHPGKAAFRRALALRTSLEALGKKEE